MKWVASAEEVVYFRTLMNLRIFTGWLILVCFPISLPAQDDDRLQALQAQISSKKGDLDIAREEVRLYEIRIKAKEQEEKDALNILYELDERISLTGRLVRALEGEIKEQTRAIASAEDAIKRGEKEIEEIREKLTARIVHIYKQGSESTLELILTSKNWNQAAYRAKYLKVAADYDRRLINRINTNIADVARQQQEVAGKRERNQAMVNEKTNEEAGLLRDKVSRQKQIAKIKQDRHNDEKILLQKKQAAAELERILASLEIDHEKREREIEAERRKRELAEVVDISGYKGRLPWPAEGRVVAHFGRQRHPTLNTVTENTGIDIKARAGADVNSILDGVVTTVTYVRGFGNTVIVDHGKNLYSVYTHVDNVSVTEGQYIDQGQVIAQVGDSGSIDGAKLHFEIWGNRQKLDPENWLAKR